jgi:myo-inositol-1-phosphate synthase
LKFNPGFTEKSDGIYSFFEQVVQYLESVNCSKQCYTSMTYSKTEHIPYNLIFAIKCNDSSIYTIISWDHLNLSLANAYVVDV